MHEEKDERTQSTTSENLAALAAAGDHKALCALWGNTWRLLAKVSFLIASKYSERMKAAGVTLEDIQQDGFLSLQHAASLYNPAKGVPFSSFLADVFRWGVLARLGLKTARQRMEPLCGAVSLQTPVNDEEGAGIELEAIVPDPAAERDMQAAEERAYTEKLHKDLDEVMRQIPADHADTLRRLYYEGRSRASLAVETGRQQKDVAKAERAALREMRAHCKTLRGYLDEIRTAHAYGHTGFSVWERSGSVEERFAERNESPAEWLQSMGVRI